MKISINENEINKIVKNIIYKIDNNLLTEALAKPSVIQDLYIKISNNKPASLKVMFQKTSVVVYGYSKGQFLTFFDNGRVKFHDGKSYFKGGGKWDYTMVKNNKLSGGWLKNASGKNVGLYDGLNQAYNNFGKFTADYGDPKKFLSPNKFNSQDFYKKINSKNYDFNSLVNILFAARNASWADGFAKKLFNKKSSIKDFATAIISFVKKNRNISPFLLKTIISTIFRESKSESANLYINPKEVLAMLHNIFGGDHSQGYAQIRPSTAKQYGIDMNSVYTFAGSLDAIYKMYLINYQMSKKYYSGPTVTIYKDNKLTKIPAIDNNSTLHMTIATHNAGSGILNNWCETNLPNIANKCSENLRVPDKSKPDVIATTKKNKKIDNYFPNIGGKLHKYMPQFKKSFDMLNSVPGIVKNLIDVTKDKYEEQLPGLNF